MLGTILSEVTRILPEGMYRISDFYVPELIRKEFQYFAG
jgi:hypothetical protein